jgi:hypothetical protein
MSESINAREFTVGSNIVFGVGQYAPESSTGKRLLANELTYTVQQSTSKSFGSVQKFGLSKLSSGLIQRDPETETLIGETSDSQTSNNSISTSKLDLEYETAVKMGDWQAAAE